MIEAYLPFRVVPFLKGWISRHAGLPLKSSKGNTKKHTTAQSDQAAAAKVNRSPEGGVKQLRNVAVRGSAGDLA